MKKIFKYKLNAFGLDAYYPLGLGITAEVKEIVNKVYIYIYSLY